MPRPAGNGQPILTDEQRIKAIQLLACFEGPTETLRELQAEWPGVKVSVQAIEALDPTRYAGRRLAKRWKAIFEATREAFLKDTAAIGIANPAYRLRQLEKIAQRQLTRGNDVLAMQAMEQAAKEVGGAFTNARILTGKDGGPILSETNVTSAGVEKALHRLIDAFGGGK
jgi:hypothetical protein